MVDLGSGSQRKLDDFKLTRYACYLIAQNGDPRIPEKEFGKTITEHGVKSEEIGEIKNAGDATLFGGLPTSHMKKQLGLQNTARPLADVLPTVTLKAKDL